MQGHTLFGKPAAREGLGLRAKLYLKKLWPFFPGDEETIGGRIVGDAIEHVGLGSAIGVGQQAVEINDAKDAPGGGIDASDGLALPDIGVNLALDELEFIEQAQRR